MKPAGRVGDIAFCPSDSHGCPGCAHPVQGPAIQGSPNVLINDNAALRDMDRGVHAACCGQNAWMADGGATHVFANDRRVYRVGDPSKHCGGHGNLIIGSANVLVGDAGGCSDRLPYDEHFILVDERTGEPIVDREYRIECSNGVIIEGRTDSRGKTYLATGDGPEEVTLFVGWQEHIVIG